VHHEYRQRRSKDRYPQPAKSATGFRQRRTRGGSQLGSAKG
jgi:hypothetical protein